MQLDVPQPIIESLVIDVGNTTVKCAVFYGGELTEKVSFKHEESHNIQLWLTNHFKPNIIISDVTSTYTQTLTGALTNSQRLIILDAHTPLPIKNRYHTPETLGKDRLAAVVGAIANFPNQNCLVIDAGTCITYDFIDAENNYWGGMITPGVNMRLKAMHEGTGRLPLVALKETEESIGKDTPSPSLLTGVQWGTVAELDGIIARFEKETPDIRIILTGGDANFLAKHLKKKIFVNQNLVLQGLNQIIHYNAAF